jgi:predicted dehydrogenase
MRILQVGAGSMGRRRLRNLAKRTDLELAVFDQRADRRERAQTEFGVAGFSDMEQALEWEPETLVISTPPDHHEEYIRLALDRGLHHFCEEHIWTYSYDIVRDVSSRKKLVSASSCSAHFLPLVRKLKEIVATRLGKLQVYQFLLSTWAPSWHPAEGPEFYARHRHMAPAREMVPFELLYLNDVFGRPARVAASVTRRGNLDLNSEDTWSLQMILEEGACAQLTVLMASPSNLRKGVCVGTNGSASFDVFTGEIALALDGCPEVRIQCGPQIDVIEAVYAEEMDTFVKALRGELAWPCSYFDSSVATATLASAELSSCTGKWEEVDPHRQPAHFPSDYPEGTEASSR